MIAVGWHYSHTSNYECRMLILLVLWRVDHNRVVLVLKGLRIEGSG